MERTNADDFRSNLKEWMESARNEPIKITRKSGEALSSLMPKNLKKFKLNLPLFGVLLTVLVMSSLEK